jgi:aspartate/tyrosine/aromatic aminotransferase
VNSIAAQPQHHTAQSLSGTGALNLAADFIRLNLGPGTMVHVPSPTWENHDNVFKQANLQVCVCVCACVCECVCVCVCVCMCVCVCVC